MGDAGLLPLQLEDVHDCLCLHSMLLLIGDAGYEEGLGGEGRLVQRVR